MPGDDALLEDAYFEHLSDHDLRLVAAGDRELASAPDPAAILRARPGMLEPLLARETAFDLVFVPEGDGRLVPASPFLVFAVAVQRTLRELAVASYVEEWLGPRRHAPVFEVEPLRDFLSDSWRRLFLAELLGSYTRVASGSFLVPTRRGLRRQRFSELDLVRLAGLLDVLPEAEHPGVYRRLGDLALFLTGVFPDHTATHGISAIDESRLLRLGRLRPRVSSDAPRPPTAPGFGDARAVELLERLGRRWYGLAYELVPPPAPRTTQLLGDLAGRFGEARRILNVLTDRFLFPFRSQWFGIGSS